MRRIVDPSRRDALKGITAAAAALALGSFPSGWTSAQDNPRRKLLFFTKSAGFQHPCITRSGEKLSHAEQVMVDLGKKHRFDVTATKDGRIFTDEGLAPFDGIMFMTTGDLTQEGTDKTPPMPANGKEVLLRAVASGKGFAGTHCASDTFHSTETKIDPYIAMLGGELIVHGEQQSARIRVVDNKFPGIDPLQWFDLMEEWYALKNFAADLHVILLQETAKMKGDMYKGPDYPETWARRHGNGRVFFTSMGHREDVWSSEVFQQVLLGGLSWILGNVDADVKPNMKQVTPGATTRIAPS
jgi:type 1 glutamine amidotransferase